MECGGRAQRRRRFLRPTTSPNATQHVKPKAVSTLRFATAVQDAVATSKYFANIRSRGVRQQSVAPTPLSRTYYLPSTRRFFAAWYSSSVSAPESRACFKSVSCFPRVGLDFVAPESRLPSATTHPLRETAANTASNATRRTLVVICLQPFRFEGRDLTGFPCRRFAPSGTACLRF